MFGQGYGAPGQPTTSPFTSNAPRFANAARPAGVGGNLGSGPAPAAAPAANPAAQSPMQRLMAFNPAQQQQFIAWIRAMQQARQPQTRPTMGTAAVAPHAASLLAALGH